MMQEEKDKKIFENNNNNINNNFINNYINDIYSEISVSSYNFALKKNQDISLCEQELRNYFDIFDVFFINFIFFKIILNIFILFHF